MFFIGQNLKHVHMAYSFLELLIFFWLTLDILCLKFQKQSSREAVVQGCSVQKVFLKISQISILDNLNFLCQALKDFT